MIARIETPMPLSRLLQFIPDGRPVAVAAAFGLFSLLPALPLMAASSDWAVNEGGRMRLVLLPEGADGLRQGALVIEPKPGWITYWKEPGDVGIPPAIKPAEGASYTLESLDFPVPKVLTSGEMNDVGYDRPVTLPITLANAPDTSGVTLNAFIGVSEYLHPLPGRSRRAAECGWRAFCSGDGARRSRARADPARTVGGFSRARTHHER